MLGALFYASSRTDAWVGNAPSAVIGWGILFRAGECNALCSRATPTLGRRGISPLAHGSRGCSSGIEKRSCSAGGGINRRGEDHARQGALKRSWELRDGGPFALSYLGAIELVFLPHMCRDFGSGVHFE